MRPVASKIPVRFLPSTSPAVWAAHLSNSQPSAAPIGIVKDRVIGKYMPIPTASGGRENFLVV